jgi:hypothetical protein
MADDNRDRPTRRELLKRAAAGAAGLALGVSLASVGGSGAGSEEADASASTGRASVVLVRDEAVVDEAGKVSAATVAAMLDRAMGALTGESDRAAAWRRFVTPDDVVGVKSTLMMTPTHPELLQAICGGLRAAGVADQHITTWDRDRAGIGMAEVSTLPRRVGYGKDSVCDVVWKSTVLINVPGLKSHWLAGMACAVKNWAGAVTGINTQDHDATYAFHADSCREVGMLNAIPPIRRKCRLIIVDALRPLCHGGPQVDPRYLWDYKGLLVGTDPVAIDTIGTAIIEGRRRQMKGGEWPLQPPVTHLAVADRKYHLGTSDRGRIDLTKVGWGKDAFV